MVRRKIKKITPTTRIGRLVVGVLLVLGGLVGFLPVLGFWMVPLGLIILSIDFPVVRRFRRRMEVKIGRGWQRWRQKRQMTKDQATKNHD